MEMLKGINGLICEKQTRNDDIDDVFGRIRHAVAAIFPGATADETVSDV